MARAVLDEIRGTPEIHISHLKPGAGQRIIDQLGACAPGRPLRALGRGDLLEFSMRPPSVRSGTRHPARWRSPAGASIRSKPMNTSVSSAVTHRLAFFKGLADADQPHPREQGHRRDHARARARAVLAVRGRALHHLRARGGRGSDRHPGQDRSERGAEHPPADRREQHRRLRRAQRPAGQHPRRATTTRSCAASRRTSNCAARSTPTPAFIRARCWWRRSATPTPAACSGSCSSSTRSTASPSPRWPRRA